MEVASAEAVADEADPHLFRSHGPIVGRTALLGSRMRSNGRLRSVRASGAVPLSEVSGMSDLPLIERFRLGMVFPPCSNVCTIDVMVGTGDGGERLEAE